MTRWPNQQRAYDQTAAAITAGEQAICVTSPTGTGKTRMMLDMLDWAAAKGWKAALFTNRKLLLEQTRGILERNGIQVGLRASGHRPALLKDVQLCMAQTELSQVYQRKNRELHDAKLVLVDEAHLQRSGGMETIIGEYKQRGAHVVGYTATPLEIGHLYDNLIVAGSVSEGRDCGALLAAHTYAPDEPDLKKIKSYKVGEDPTPQDNAKAIMRPGVVSRVYDNWKRLNPDALPTILFGPDVDGSLYFAQEFWKKGVRACHIDGKDTWVDGELHPEPEAREWALAQVRSGEIPIVCNRFVLREGIDLPELFHAIFATVFGALTSFLQSAGRLLRNHPSLDHVIIQDHGGNYHRFGSVNVDREWTLGLTNHVACGLRQDALREKKEHEPIVCPECSGTRHTGRACPYCGHITDRRGRVVVQASGQLSFKEGDVYRPRKVKEKSNTSTLWKSIYHGGKKTDQTFNQRYAWFWQQHHYWPPKTLPFMPKEPADWYRKVKDVPREALYQPGEVAEPAMF